MANIKSHKKRILTNEKSRQRNIDVVSRLRTYMKKAQTAIESNEPEAVKTAVRDAISEIDRAARKGVIHKKQAARRKSNLQTKANKVIASAN